LNDCCGIWEENFTCEKQHNVNHPIPIINKKNTKETQNPDARTTLALLNRNVKFCMAVVLRKIFIPTANKFRIYYFNENLYSEIAENSVTI
jgi:hypothetical protein